MDIEPDGDLVATGQFDAHLGIARLSPSGQLDPSLAATGIAISPDFTPREEVAWGNGIAADEQGAILASGTTARIGTDPGSGGRDSIAIAHDFAVARFAVDGALDPSFGGGDGQRNTDFLTGDDLAASSLLTPALRYVVAGTAGDALTGPDMAVARYTLMQGRADADADGLTDRRDRCPEAYSKTRRGCPTLRRALDLEYSKKRDAFIGTMRSRYRKCYRSRDERIQIVQMRKGRDEVLFEEKPYSTFEVRYGAPRGRFFARIGSLDLTVRGRCAADRTAPLKLP